jgi:HAMP domain-containing protein
MKIAKKIGLSIFIVAAILTVIIASGFYIVSRNYLEKTVYTHLSAIARSKVHHIETFLNVGEESIKQLSKSIVIERFLLASEGDEDYNKRLNDIVRRLEDTNRTTKYAYEFFVLNEDGIIVASNIKGDIGKDKSSVPYFLGEGEGAFTKGAFVSKDEKLNSITFSAKVFDEDDAVFLGVVAAKASIEEVNKITEDGVGLGRTGEIYLVNKSGLMIIPSHFMKDAFLNLRVDTEDKRKCFEDAQKSGSKSHSHELFVYTDYRGAKVWGVHEHIPQMACALWVKIDEKEALAPLATIELLAFIITGIVPIIAWLIGSLIAGAITSPIHKLHRGTEIIGEGNLDYKVGTDAKDEIGQLSRAFDEMTEDLRKTTTSIVNLNKEIADRKRVERELEKVNRQLEFSVEHANNLAQEATVAYLAKSQFLER